MFQLLKASPTKNCCGCINLQQACILIGYCFCILGAIEGGLEVTFAVDAIQRNPEIKIAIYVVLILAVVLDIIEIALSAGVIRSAHLKCRKRLIPWIYGSLIIQFISSFLVVVFITGRSGLVEIFCLKLGLTGYGAWIIYSFHESLPATDYYHNDWDIEI